MSTRRFLLDQMIDETVATELRLLGHDAVRVSEFGMATADDDEILKRAIAEDRILLTLDGHFGDWAVLPLDGHPGVIRIRVSPTSSAAILAVLLPFLGTHVGRTFANLLVIVKPTGVRWIKTGA